MDPITQGAIGAAASLKAVSWIKSLHRQTTLKEAMLVGALAGMAPDLDILIRSELEPLMALKYHRHFSHSLIMIPVGGAIVGSLYCLLRRGKLSLKASVSLATVGWGTHGLLDACTSYGTLLFWPFSMERVAWDWISIIDPFFTLPLILGIMFTLFRKNFLFNHMGVVIAALWLSLASWQHHRASLAQLSIAAKRGHVMERRSLNPSLFNVIVWRSYYQSEGKLWADAIRLDWSDIVMIWEGGSIDAYPIQTVLSELPTPSNLKDDLQTYQWFANDYLAKLAPETIGDFRYALTPDSTTPLWGISFELSKPDQHVQRLDFFQERNSAIKNLWSMIIGQKPGSFVLAE